VVIVVGCETPGDSDEISAGFDSGTPLLPPKRPPHGYFISNVVGYLRCIRTMKGDLIQMLLVDMTEEVRCRHGKLRSDWGIVTYKSTGIYGSTSTTRVTVKSTVRYDTGS
jgi:hypothetical protein